MRMTVISVAVVVAAIAALASCKGKESDVMHIDYEEYTLDNGLKVVLHEDHSDPIVAQAIAFHVGSAREKEGKTGFAHFFEHMLFQRSENLPRNAFFNKISDMGGTFNGGTSNDYTIYYECVPRDALEKILWMESDRMGFFINTVTQSGLEREIDVICNEKFGAGSAGRLFEVLRLQRGYTYGASSSFTSNLETGYFHAASSVQGSSTKESVALFKEIIDGFGDAATQLKNVPDAKLIQAI